MPSLIETAAERIRNFRTERISNVIAGETPVLLDENAPKLCCISYRLVLLSQEQGSI